ncbi:DUF3592 domain-containing protein [Ferrimonas aestuarii]|uniref:DUF3592 domain-containing protein n=1 Tax=Ferrimonas aestuarii TaxID=2569539 RepID=A0A4U1BQC1_9GAMM|nr:DUF3592 domain-containing protein [Ferrimonas aestuarii]TKB56606.1 DUF3592 domain-containing protein [Ferrimonas aestuarii]
MKRFKLSQVSFLMWFMFIIFSFAVGLATYVVHQFHASFNWPTAKGIVVDCWIVERYHERSSAESHYEVGIEYLYIIDGEVHHKNNKTDITGAIPGYSLEEAEALAAQFPSGKMIQVHYKPSDHDTAVIRPTMHLFMIVGLVLFSLVLLPVCYVMYLQMTSDPDSYIVRHV